MLFFNACNHLPTHLLGSTSTEDQLEQLTLWNWATTRFFQFTADHCWGVGLQTVSHHNKFPQYRKTFHTFCDSREPWLIQVVTHKQGREVEIESGSFLTWPRVMLSKTFNYMAFKSNFFLSSFSFGFSMDIVIDNYITFSFILLVGNYICS